MVYILNTPINPNKKCVLALSQFFGLGFPLIHQICDQLGFSPQLKCKQLNASQIDGLTRCISQNYICGADLRGIIKKNKERFISTSAFRGFRYIEGLPCRGQRTHGNAQTARRCNPKAAPVRLQGTKRKSSRSRG